jgi:hypothetical protein
MRETGRGKWIPLSAGKEPWLQDCSPRFLARMLYAREDQCGTL